MRSLKFFLKFWKHLNTRTLAGVMLCAIVLAGTLPMMGCNGVTVAQDIVNWTPTLQSAVASSDALGAILAPEYAVIFAAATTGFDAASNVLVAQAKAYLANPNATLLSQLQTAVVTLQQQVNAALLAAVKIVDPASQAKALADINAVGTVVSAILSLVASISSKAAVQRMAAASTVKLSQVEPYLTRGQNEALIEAHYKAFSRARGYYGNGIAQLERQGF